jgi:hypothetical protein
MVQHRNKSLHFRDMRQSAMGKGKKKMRHGRIVHKDRPSQLYLTVRIHSFGLAEIRINQRTFVVKRVPHLSRMIA